MRSWRPDRLRPPVRARLGPVRGDQIDVVAAAAATLQAMAQGGDRLPVGEPRRCPEHGPRAGGDRGDPPGRHVHDVDGRPRREVRIPTAVGDERHPRAIGRPGWLVVVDGAVRQARGLARGGVHDPEVLDLVVEEPGRIEHVLEPVDESIVGLGRLAGRGLRALAPPSGVLGVRRAMGRADSHEARAVGRPIEPRHAAGQVGQPARLTAEAIERKQMDLLDVLAVLLLRRATRLVLDDRPSIREERQRQAIRGEAGMPVVSRPDRQLARSRRVRAVIVVETSQRAPARDRRSKAGAPAVRRDGRGGRSATAHDRGAERWLPASPRTAGHWRSSRIADDRRGTSRVARRRRRIARNEAGPPASAGRPRREARRLTDLPRGVWSNGRRRRAAGRCLDVASRDPGRGPDGGARARSPRPASRPTPTMNSSTGSGTCSTGRGSCTTGSRTYGWWTPARARRGADRRPRQRRRTRLVARWHRVALVSNRLATRTSGLGRRSTSSTSRPGGSRGHRPARFHVQLPPRGSPTGGRSPPWP